MRPIVGNLLRSRFQIYILLSVKNLSFFYINSLIILTILVKIYLNSLLHEYFQNYFFWFISFYIHQSIPPKVYVKKNFFSTFFHLFFSRYCCFIRFFFLKRFHLTFPAANFAHHAPIVGKLLRRRFQIYILL